MLNRGFRTEIFFRFFMNRLGMDDNGSGRRRTGELTRAASDAVLLIDFRVQNVFLINKADGVRGADFAAGAAIPMIDKNNANIF